MLFETRIAGEEHVATITPEKRPGVKVSELGRRVWPVAQTVVCAAKTRRVISAGWSIAKRCCFIESIGDTFAQC
jgi:hypothetical protein